MTAQEFITLLNKWRAGNITRQEAREFIGAVRSGSHDDILEETIGLDAELNWFEEGFTAEGMNKDWEAIADKMQPKAAIMPAHRIPSLPGGRHFLRTTWFRYAAAVIILFGIGAYLWNAQQKEKPLITESKPVPVKNDIAPGFDRAVLTLSNGQQVELDRAASQTIKDGTLSIKNTNGQLSYTENGSPFSPSSPFEEGGGAKRRGISYNTMTTPKGGQYQLTLSDGTKVWLNAASSITYPVAFNNKTREVSIIGEAYFEVAKNKEKPFIVNVAYLPLAGVAAQRPRVDRERSERTEGYRITVLGTSFNVNAYADEVSMKTSLLEGSVKIGKSILRPGQAYVNGAVVSTNVEQDLAWKNGLFTFAHSDIKAVMRQLARWYDVEIKYEGVIPEGEFSGKIDRNLSLSKVLSILSAYGINYRIESNKVVITKS